jgi:hypothetical protein
LSSAPIGTFVTVSVLGAMAFIIVRDATTAGVDLRGQLRSRPLSGRWHELCRALSSRLEFYSENLRT